MANSNDQSALLAAVLNMQETLTNFSSRLVQIEDKVGVTVTNTADDADAGGKGRETPKPDNTSATLMKESRKKRIAPQSVPPPSGTEPRQYQGDLQLNSSIDDDLIHDDVDEQRSSNDDDSPSSPDYSPPEESDNSSLGSNDPGYDNEANADALLLLDQVKQHIREVTQYAENSNSFADTSELTTQCTEMLSRIHEIVTEAKNTVQIYGNDYFMSIATTVKTMAKINLLSSSTSPTTRMGPSAF